MTHLLLEEKHEIISRLDNAMEYCGVLNGLD